MVFQVMLQQLAAAVAKTRKDANDTVSPLPSVDVDFLAFTDFVNFSMLYVAEQDIIEKRVLQLEFALRR